MLEGRPERLILQKDVTGFLGVILLRKKKLRGEKFLYQVFTVSSFDVLAIGDCLTGSKQRLSRAN